MKSSDNPHKPGTQEWKDYERCIINEQQFALSDSYREAKAVADKRIKTAGERYAAEHEKGVWVDEILEFLEGDTPEYDEELDGKVEIRGLADLMGSGTLSRPTSSFWNTSVNSAPDPDPINWQQLINQMYMNAALVGSQNMQPVFKGNYVFPMHVPAEISSVKLHEIMLTATNKQYDKEHYDLGRVEIPVRIERNFFQALPGILDPDWVVVVLYIKEIK